MKKKGGKRRLFLIFILIILSILWGITTKALTGDAITGESITGKASTQPTNVSVFILPSTSNPVLGPINTSIFICEAEVLRYEFNATDANSDDLTLTINPEDPFYIAYPPTFYGQKEIDSAIISGKLTKTDAGGTNTGSQTYEVNVSVSDGGTSDSALTNITVIEINNAPSLVNIGVQTVWTQGESSTLYIETEGSDIEGTLNYNETLINASSGAAVDLFNISYLGVINFTPNVNQIGIYNATICINDSGIENPHENISTECGEDGSGKFVCDDFTITITDENRAPEITDYDPDNLNFTIDGTETTIFNITKNDPEGTVPDSYWYIDGEYQSYYSGSSIDEFIYTFGCGISGNHNVTVDVTDGLLNTSLQWNITVNYVSCTPSLSPGGGSGGGSSAATTKNFSIDREEINVILKPEQSKLEELTITNHEKTNLSIIISNPDLKEFITISQDKFILEPKQEKTIILDFEAYENTIPNLYLGELIINGDATRKRVLVSIEVESKQPIFDIKIELLEESLPVLPGKELLTNISIYNLGEPGEFDVLIEYIIMNERGQEILLDSETVTVNDQLSFIKSFKIPKNIEIDRYVLYVKVTYEGETGSSSVWFSPEPLPTNIWLIVLVITISLLAIISIILAIKKIRSKLQEDEIAYGFRPTKS